VQEAAAGADDVERADRLGMVRRIRERVDALLKLAQLEVRAEGSSMSSDEGRTLGTTQSRSSHRLS
jgi:hypothetical protein